MINRRMLLSDDLGNSENLNEVEKIDGNEVGLRTFATYTLALTDSR